MDLKVLRDYSPEDKENAFQLYKDLKQGNRSLRKTSRISGIPFTTLSYWNRTMGWQQRMWEEDSRDAALIDQTVKLRLVNELDGLMDHLLWLAYNGTNEHKVQADMVKHGLAIASVSAVQKVQSDITQVVEARHTIREDADQLEAMSLDQLAEKLNTKMRELSGGVPQDDEPIPEGVDSGELPAGHNDSNGSSGGTEEE